MRANQIPCLASFAPLGAAIALPLELPLALGRIRMGRSNTLPPGSTVADVLGLVRGAVKKRRGCGKSLTPAETFEVGSLWVRGTAWGPARASRGSAAGADGLRRAVAEQRPYTRSPTRPAGGRSDRATRCPSNDPIRGRRPGRVAAGVLRGGRRGGQSGGLRNADSEQRPYRWRPTRLAAGRLDRAARCPSNDPIRGRRGGACRGGEVGAAALAAGGRCERRASNLYNVRAGPGRRGWLHPRRVWPHPHPSRCARRPLPRAGEVKLARTPRNDRMWIRTQYLGRARP